MAPVTKPSFKDIAALSASPAFQNLVANICPKYLEKKEVDVILQQFSISNWSTNRHVLWSGTNYFTAKDWATKHGFQTLTHAMGPLMDPSHAAFQKLRKSPKRWSGYVMGASAIFAWRLSLSGIAVVLTPPPPHRFNPSGRTTYQDIEEPIVKGVLGNQPVSKIIVYHPEVKGAEDFGYEAWPVDRRNDWVERYGSTGYSDKRWRQVSTTRVPMTWTVENDASLPRCLLRR